MYVLIFKNWTTLYSGEYIELWLRQLGVVPGMVSKKIHKSTILPMGLEYTCTYIVEIAQVCTAINLTHWLKASIILISTRSNHCHNSL